MTNICPPSYYNFKSGKNKQDYLLKYMGKLMEIPYKSHKNWG